MEIIEVKDQSINPFCDLIVILSLHFVLEMFWLYLCRPAHESWVVISLLLWISTVCFGYFA